MASDPSVIEVYSEGEKLLPFSSVPTFNVMLQVIEDQLGTSRDLFVLLYTDPSGDEHQIDSEEGFQEAFAQAELPFIIRLERLPEPTAFYCPYCDSPLEKLGGQCQTCETVNWDAWFIEKYGDENYRTLMETKAKEAKGFSFGPVELLHEPPKVFEVEAREEHMPGFVEEDEDLNQRGSLGEFQRGSFGEPTDTGKFETPPRKPSPKAEQADPKPRYQPTEDLLSFDTPPRGSEAKSDGKPQMETPPSKVPEAILTESPPVRREPAEPYHPRPYRSGLHPSPYLSAEKPTMHDRSTCEICLRSKHYERSNLSGHDRTTCDVCQRSLRGSSPLLRQSEYKDSLFRYSQVTGESSAFTRDSYRVRQSSPLRNSRFLSEESLFASRSSGVGGRRSYANPVDYSLSRGSFTKPLRESSPPARHEECGTVWTCRKCPNRPPWYFTHCQKCELTLSLSQQPFDSYKRRVELMCRH